MSKQSNIIYTCRKCKTEYTKKNKYNLCYDCNKCTCNLCGTIYHLTKYSPVSLNKHAKEFCHFANLGTKMTKCWKCLAYNGRNDKCYTCGKHFLRLDRMGYGPCCSTTCALITDSCSNVHLLPFYDKSLVNMDYVLKIDYEAQISMWKDMTLYFNLPKYRFLSVTLGEDMINCIDYDIYRRSAEDIDDNIIDYKIISATIIKRN